MVEVTSPPSDDGTTDNVTAIPNSKRRYVVSADRNPLLGLGPNEKLGVSASEDFEFLRVTP